MKILDTFPDAPINPPQTGVQTLVLGGGCFWCTEAVFQTQKGVISVLPGYAGGDPDRANYKDVCQKDTGHIEVIQITYDADEISLGALLKTFFWLAHDPTQTDGQGHDIGPQYLSVIFYANETQHEVARAYIELLNDQNVYGAPIATQLRPLDTFFVAEDYHHNYAVNHADEPYIRGTALPKMFRALLINDKV